MLENISKIKTPDLIMDIKATPEQMADFGLEIQGSKIIRRGKPGKVEGDTGTFLIPDAIFDFSTENKLLINQPLVSSSGEVHLGDVKLTYGVHKDVGYNLKSFPDAVSVFLNYFTPKTKPRTNVPGEYRAGNYFELKVTNKDGSKKTFYLEQNLEIFDR